MSAPLSLHFLVVSYGGRPVYQVKTLAIMCQRMVSGCLGCSLAPENAFVSICACDGCTWLRVTNALTRCLPPAEDEVLEDAGPALSEPPPRPNMRRRR